MFAAKLQTLHPHLDHLGTRILKIDLEAIITELNSTHKDYSSKKVYIL